MISNAAPCVPATCTAPTAGTACSSLSLHATRASSHVSISALTQRSCSKSRKLLPSTPFEVHSGNPDSIPYSDLIATHVPIPHADGLKTGIWLRLVPILLG